MRIIILSSYTSIWYYAFAEAVIAHALQRAGHEIIYITPGKKFTTRSSQLHEKILRKVFNLRGHDLSNILSNQETNIACKYIELLNKDNFEKLIIDDVPVGKYSIYEYLLSKKKMSSRLTTKDWDTCRNEIYLTTLSLLGCRKILGTEKSISALIMYNNLYPLNHVWEVLFSKNNIPVYFMGNGSNLSDIDETLIIGKKNSLHFIESLIRLWNKGYKSHKITKAQAGYVTDHFLELLRARNPLVYSVPKSVNNINIRSMYGISDIQRILTATMSSYDELFASQYIGVKKMPSNLIFVKSPFLATRSEVVVLHR